MSAPPSQPSQSQPSATTFNERLNEQLINCLNIQTNVIQNLAQYSQHISLQLFEIKNTVEILSNRVLTLQQQQSHYGPAPPPAAHLPSPYYPNYPHPPPPPSTLPPSFTSSFMGHPPPPMPFGIPPQAYAEPRGPASMSNISHGNLPAFSHPAASVPPTSLSNPAPFSFATTTASSTITTASASAAPIPSISSKPIVSAPASVPPSTTVATTSTSSASTSSQSIFSNLLKQNPTDNNGHKTTPFFPPPPAGSNQTNGSPFNFGFNAPGSNIFGVGLANSSVSNSSASKVEAHAADDDDEAGGEDNSYEPNVSFKPIVQLSAVEVKTGEEDENVLFCERAKLYRFDRDSNQMKERGIGEMKILQHKTTQICRVLMRREQVLKLCANHQISAQMDLKPHGGSANTYVWSAMDFADGEAKHETLCVRFKTDEQAKRFAKVFNEAKEVNSKKSSEESSASNTETKEKETGSDDEVVPLGEVQPSAEQVDRAKKLQLPSTFYLYENKEPCKGCPGCEDDSSSNENQPASKAQNETKATVPPAASKTPLSSSENIKFSFGANAEKAQPTLQKQSSTTKDEEKAAPASSSTPDTSSTGTPYDNKPSIFGSLSGNASQSIFGGSPAMNGGIASLFGSNPLKPAGTGTSGFSFPGFGSPTTTSATSTTATTTTTTSTSSTGTFSFAAAVSNANNSTPSGSPFSFGLQGSSAGSKPLFGNASGFSFADLAKQSAASPANDQATNGNEQRVFAGQGSLVFGTSALNVTSTGNNHEDEEGEGGGDDDSYEPSISFKPVVQLAAVEVKTGEEDEEILFCERAKLYRFDREANQMKERGIGEMKILQHKTTHQYRIVMRREQVLKLCANHQITSQMELKPHGGSENTYVWSAMDYADGEAKHETLCIRFKTADQAKRFVKLFNEAKEAHAKAHD